MMGLKLFHISKRDTSASFLGALYVERAFRREFFYSYAVLWHVFLLSQKRGKLICDKLKVLPYKAVLRLP